MAMMGLVSGKYVSHSYSWYGFNMQLCTTVTHAHGDNNRT